MIPLPDREKWLGELSFLTRRDTDIPLPVYTPHLIEVMKSVREDHLPPDLFIEGMVLLLAADPDFVHAGAYREELTRDPALMQVLRAKMNDLTEERHPLALAYAIALYGLEEEAESASAAALLLADHDPKTARILADRHPEANTVSLARRLVVYQKLGDVQKSERVLQQLIDLQAPGEEFYRGQLRELQKQKAEEEAAAALEREDFHQVIAIVDEVGETLRSAKLYALRGTANQGLGLFDASIRDLEEAGQRGVRTPEIYNDLSIAYYLTGDADTAIDRLQEGLSVFAQDERMLYNLFVYAIQSDRTDLALQALETLQTLEIRDPAIRADLERILRQ